MGGADARIADRESRSDRHCVPFAVSVPRYGLGSRRPTSAPQFVQLRKDEGRRRPTPAGHESGSAPACWTVRNRATSKRLAESRSPVAKRAVPEAPALFRTGSLADRFEAS